MKPAMIKEYEARFREELVVLEAYKNEVSLLRAEVKVLRTQLQNVSELAGELRDVVMPIHEKGPQDY